MFGVGTMVNFLFESPTGKPIEVEPFHYCIVGQTQFSGKSTLVMRLAEWAAADGYKVLIFDSKETEADYSGFGREVPVCLRETTDSFVLIGLLESMFRRRLTPYYATLTRLTEGAKGFDDIITRAKELEARSKSGWLRDTCRVLYDLLGRLKEETSKVRTIPQLQLESGINRMVINDFSLEGQQLIVKNAFEDALRIYKRNLIVIVDEAFKFLPQGYSSAATRAIMNLMTQGAKTNLFGWISTQFLALTDKDPLKACAVKFLGTQDHVTEVKHTLDLIPEAKGKLTKDNVMKLKLGHWVLVRKRPPYVGIVYSLPVGVPEAIGQNVAMGRLSPEAVRDRYLMKKEGEEEMVDVEALKKEIEHKAQIMMTDALHGLEGKIRQDLQPSIDGLSQQVKILTKDTATIADRQTKLGEELRKELAGIKGALKGKPITLEAKPSEGTAQKETISLQEKELVIDLSHVAAPVEINTDDPQGVIMLCAVKDLKREGFDEMELGAALKERGCNMEPIVLHMNLGKLTKRGWIVKSAEKKPFRYRLPTKITLNVKES